MTVGLLLILRFRLSSAPGGLVPGAADSAGYLVESALGGYSSGLCAEWGPSDEYDEVEATTLMPDHPNDWTERCAPGSLPTFATAQFKRFFDYGRAIRCMLPLGAGRFMHLVVLYGYQGADSDPEQLALTDQLFDAALVSWEWWLGGSPV